MASGRFLRRGALRAGLAAMAAAPFGAPASGAAAMTGAAQEHAAAGVVGALVAGRLAVQRRDDPKLPWRLAVGVAVGIGTRFVWPVAAKAPAEVHRHRSYTVLHPGDDGRGVGIVVNPRAGSGALGSQSPRSEEHTSELQSQSNV